MALVPIYWLRVILFSVLITNGAKSLPHKSNLGSSFGNSSFLKNSYSASQRTFAQDYRSQREGDAAGRSSGKIVFPRDDSDDDQQPYAPLPEPSCSVRTFCEDAANYPKEVVESALRMNRNLNLLSGADLVPNIVHRVNMLPEDTALCESYEQVVYPKVAQNKDKEWLFIVNQGDFRQGVRVEICGKENCKCNLIEGFAEGYRTFCKQKYIYRQLAAVTPRGQIKLEKFRFPASCCCHAEFTGNLLFRMGGRDPPPEPRSENV